MAQASWGEHGEDQWQDGQSLLEHYENLIEECHRHRCTPTELVNNYRAASIAAIVQLTINRNCPAQIAEAARTLLLFWLAGDRSIAVRTMLNYILCPLEFVENALHMGGSEVQSDDFLGLHHGKDGSDSLTMLIIFRVLTGEKCLGEHALECAALHALSMCGKWQPLNGASLNFSGALADLQLICTLGRIIDSRCSRGMQCEGVDAATGQLHCIERAPRDYWDGNDSHPATLFGETVSLEDLMEPLRNVKQCYPNDRLFRCLDLWLRGIPTKELWEVK